MLDAPLSNLAIDRFIHLLLRLPNLFNDRLTATRDIQCRPREQRSHRVQIGAKRITSNPCRLEWHTSSATKAVTYTRDVSELPFTKLLHQIRDTRCMCSQMGIDLLPRILARTLYLLRTVTVFQPLIIREPEKDELL